MDYQELIGYYTYRGFLDNPLPVNDFNIIKSAEAELFLIIQADGGITGTLSVPAEPGASEKLFMDITGNIKSGPSPITLEFKAQGRPNTAISGYLHEYSCSVTHTWEKGDRQRLALTGTVLQFQDESGKQIAKNGVITASFVAVKRDFPEARDIHGVAIIPSALSMLASKSHRLMHAVWHSIRGRGIWYRLSEENKTTIRNLGWGLDRPPFDQNGDLNLGNGAGEDFLFMHRKMITMVRDKYNSQGVPYIESWKSLPPPSVLRRFPPSEKIVVVDTQQFFYSDQDDPQNAAKKIYRFNVLESGNMVPPAYLIPSGNKEQDLRSFRSLKFLKSQDYFNNVMSRLERIFKNKAFLATISLGTLGNLIEFEIHNQMHMRWSSTPHDPNSGEPAERGDFDFDIKWDDPKYDYLGDFYSSHVHPLFWKLHGWVDDRIEDWFNAHEAIHAGEIERYEYQGVKWFKPGKWVQVSKPYYWPEQQHHDHHVNDQDEIDAMLKVMEIIRILVQGPGEARDRFIQPEVSKIMSFMRDIMPEK